jgi:TRAP-type C4-dicarboxylate transport system permease small subunit
VSGRIAGIYARFLDACGLAAGVGLGLLAVLISLDVALRNLGLGPLGWLLETSEYVLYGATFLAAPWVLRLGAHVRVDLLLDVVPRGAARLLEVVADGIGAAVSLVLLHYSALAALEAFRLGSMILKELVLPEWCLLAVIPISALLLAVEFTLRIRRALADEPVTTAGRGLADGI